MLILFFFINNLFSYFTSQFQSSSSWFHPHKTPPSSSPLRKRSPPHAGYLATVAHKVIIGIGTATPGARQGSPFRGMGSSSRQQIQGLHISWETQMKT